MADEEDMFNSLPVPDNFDFTPELLAQRRKGRQFHPFLTSEDPTDWHLPALDDKAGILDLLGFHRDGISIMLDAYARRYTSDPGELAVWTVSDTGHGYYDFPLVYRLTEIYFKRPGGDNMYDHDDTYERSVCKAVQQGLKPEFAIRVALHPDEPEYAERFAEIFAIDGAFYRCNDVVDINRVRLTNAWNKVITPPQPTNKECKASMHR